MIIEKQENGSLRVADIVRDPKRGGEFFFSQVFYGYTKREAVARYREAMKANGYYLAR